MKKIILLFAFLIFTIIINLPVVAVECEGDPPSGADKVNELQEYQKKCESKISSLQSEQKTLSSAINLLSSKVKLTQAQVQSTTAQIQQLETEISSLSEVITDLNVNLDQLTTVFVSRVRELYKTRDTNPMILLFASDSYSTFQNRLKYLNNAQRRDQLLIKELESARLDFDKQKTFKEEKQTEVEALKKRLEQQQITLAAQQKQKQILLVETQNSETKYQTLLAKAVAELAAIESIVAGKGSEVEVGDVSPNQKIATIINGPSACSTGAHLHFEVVQNQTHQSPANFLKSISVIWSNSPDSAFGFSGSWDWPLKEPVRITQGYGHTSYSSRYVNNSHTGIDMTSTSDLEVKSVRPGKLYRGSIACGGGTLKYVHVKHSSENYDTFYLHVNYF